MHLKKVTIKNFRCFKDLSIDLHERLTVLVAENGGGKTAVLDGIALGLSPVLRYLSSADQRLSRLDIKDTDFRLEQLKDANEERQFTSEYVQLIVEAASGMKWDRWSASVRGKQPEQKIGQVDLTEYIDKVLKSLRTETPELLPVFAYYGARRGWIVIPERLRETKVDYTQPTSALVDALESLSDFKEMLKWFDVEEADELRANRGKLQTDYHESPALAEVRAAIIAILGGAYKDPHFNRRHKFVVESGSGLELLQISQLSQGYQSMLALAMDFARRLALANPSLFHAVQDHDFWFTKDYATSWPFNEAPSKTPLGPAWVPAIMLIDEVDLHLHPSWQQRVLTDLMRAFPGTQFIVTTHSPQVLSTVPMECIRIIKNGVIYSAPPGTYGAEAQRILEDVFQVPARPNNAIAQALDEYLRLIDKRQWNTPHALKLRETLDAWSQGQEPKLVEADIQIDNLRWEAGS